MDDNKKGLKIEKVGDIKEEIKKIPKDKTLAQTLLPGCIILIFSVIIGLSLTNINSCEISCIIKGSGLGTAGLTILYIIGKALSDYGFY